MATVGLTVNPQQAAVLANASEPVMIYDTEGHVIGYAVAVSPEEIAIVEEAQRRLASDEPRLSFDQVLEKLRAS